MALNRTVALVGMMGAGKTSIGKRLAARLAVPFHDADHEIEAAASLSVAEIFTKFGEAEFRRLERSVIARLLGEAPHVLATGGGAPTDAATRAALKDRAFTIWLKAPVPILLSRVKKRGGRPLLDNPDPAGTLEKLLAARAAFYAQAEMTLETAEEPHVAALDKIVAALRRHGLWQAP